MGFCRQDRIDEAKILIDSVITFLGEDENIKDTQTQKELIRKLKQWSDHEETCDYLFELKDANVEKLDKFDKPDVYFRHIDSAIETLQNDKAVFYIHAVIVKWFSQYKAETDAGEGGRG